MDENRKEELGMFQEIRAGLGVLALFTLLTGVLYPLVVTGVGQTLFPLQAGGSLVEKEGKIIGSSLIGQNFTGDGYFHGRPSAAGNGYDAGNSSGSNLAPSSADLIKTVTARVAALRESGDARPVPVDLVTASGSGLDPDISVAAAKFQAGRVAEARGVTAAEVEKLIAKKTTPRSLGVFGEKRVNVLAINQALDLLPSSVPSVAP